MTSFNTASTAGLQDAKQCVLDLQSEFDAAADSELEAVLNRHASPDMLWRGMHPFYEQTGTHNIVEVFWKPLRHAMGPLQRRQDVFLAGHNDVDGGNSIWVCSLGHFLGLFDHAWLGIPPTGRMLFLPYAEFHKVEDNRVVESALFCDIISAMRQAGHYPLPPQTGAAIVQPGPRTHDGLLFDTQPPDQGVETMALVNRMVASLSVLNETGNDACPPELLAETWHDDMIWYGPAGIGASYTIRRYQKQHQFPFRKQLSDKVFNGHIARFAEGRYACFFGWSNLTNTARGGFLGMTGNDVRADMRVVDVYRREGDKLAENWVIIDLLHYLSMQGLDVLQRMRESSLGR